MALASGVKLLKISGASSASQYSFCQWNSTPYYFATCVNEAGRAVFYQSRDAGETWFLVETLEHGVSTAVRNSWGGAQLATDRAAIVNLDVGYQVAEFPYPPSGEGATSGTPVPVPEVSTANGICAISYGSGGHVSIKGDPRNTDFFIGGSEGLIYLWGDQRTTLNWVNENATFFLEPIFWVQYQQWFGGQIFGGSFETDSFPFSRGKTGQMTGWVNGGSGSIGAAPFGYWFEGLPNSIRNIYQFGEPQGPHLWRSINDTEWEDAGGGGCATGPFPMSSSDGQRSCVYGWVADFEAVAGVDPGGTFYVSLRGDDGIWGRKVVCSIGGVEVDYVWMPYSLGHLVLGFAGNVPGQGYGLYVIIDHDPTNNGRRVNLDGNLFAPSSSRAPTTATATDRRADTW